MNKFIKTLAVGFGLGGSPVMPGTIGTLLGLPLAWGVLQFPSVWCQAVTCLILSLLAIPICGKAEKMIGGKDPGCIVADEYLTLPITVIGFSAGVPWWVLMNGFLLHRVFDITKPPPIRQLQHVHGGFGIVIDDFLAALVALGCNHLIFSLMQN